MWDSNTNNPCRYPIRPHSTKGVGDQAYPSPSGVDIIHKEDHGIYRENSRDLVHLSHHSNHHHLDWVGGVGGVSMIQLAFTDEEMEGLQSILCTADLSRITERSMRGVAGVMYKVYQYRESHTFSEIENG